MLRVFLVISGIVLIAMPLIAANFLSTVQFNASLGFPLLGLGLIVAALTVPGGKGK